MNIYAGINKMNAHDLVPVTLVLIKVEEGMKFIHEKLIANIVHNDERMKVSPKIKNKRGCSLLPLLCNTLLQVLARASRQEEETKGIQVGKG